MVINDLTGNRFGRLIVIKRNGSKNGHAAWLCKCDCGAEKTIRSCDLVNGKSTSCGCFHNEMVSNITRSHELCGKRIYNIYNDMIQRCYNPLANGFIRYGGRGISVCEEWKCDNKAFFSWALSNGYTDNLSLDRINNNGNYCPENCRWATAHEQRMNQERMKKKYNGA